MIEEKKTIKPKVQNIILENRQKLFISGIIDVGSFNETIVVVDTEMGILEIKGSSLHMSKLNLDASELNIEGNINSLEYKNRDNNQKGGGSFLAKLFK